MNHCPARALLVVTGEVEGTSTHIARERWHLRCGLGVDHDGPHRDEAHDASWEGATDQLPTLLRHEDEEV